MYTSINIFILLLSLTWSFLKMTNLHFVVLAQLLLTALDVEPNLYEKIMILVGLAWVLLVLKPLYNVIRDLIK